MVRTHQRRPHTIYKGFNDVFAVLLDQIVDVPKDAAVQNKLSVLLGVPPSQRTGPTDHMVALLDGSGIRELAD